MAAFHEFWLLQLGSFAYSPSEHHRKCWPEALWVPKCKPRARASFGHSMYSTALQYKVLNVVSQPSKYVRRLAVRAMQHNSWSQLKIITNTLESTESAYSQGCADLKHFPEAMARHICDKYRHVDPVRFPDQSVQLDHAQNFKLVNLTGRKSGRQHAQMKDGEGSYRGRKRVCVETFSR